MSDLGNLLRQGREARGLTLAQAEKDTHIRQAYLEALEDGRHEGLPDAVYARGLAISYSRYLRLDEAEAKRLVDAEYGPTAMSEHTVGSYQPLGVPLRVGRRRWIAYLLAFLAVAVLAFLAWWYRPVWEPWGERLIARVSVQRAPTEVATATPTLPVAVGTSPTATGGSAALPTPTSAALPLPTPTTKPTATPTSVARASPTRPSGIVMTVECTSLAWLQIVADGTIVYEGTLRSGVTKEWTARQSMLIRTGNAGGTQVTVNGEQVGVLGAPGAVAERLWVFRGGIAVEATPEE